MNPVWGSKAGSDKADFEIQQLAGFGPVKSSKMSKTPTNGKLRSATRTKKMLNEILGKIAPYTTTNAGNGRNPIFFPRPDSMSKSIKQSNSSKSQVKNCKGGFQKPNLSLTVDNNLKPYISQSRSGKSSPFEK